MKPVLAAVDLGSASAKVASVAAEVAGPEGQVVPIHILTHERLEDYRASLPTEGAFLDVLQSRLSGDVADLFASVPTATAPVVAIGEAASELISQAEGLDASFIVIGVRNRSRVGKLLMGSTAQEVLLNSPCPVVGVPI